LTAYFAHEAQPWEALMYTKMRFLAGSQTLGERAIAALKTLFERFAADAGFPHAVREMRTKLEVAEAPGKSFKYSPGRSMTLISSPASAGEACRGGQAGSLRDRPVALCGFRCPRQERRRHTRPCCRIGCARWSTWRGWWVGRPIKWAAGDRARTKVADKLTGQILERQFPDRLESELDGTFEKVRAIYEKVLMSSHVWSRATSPAVSVGIRNR